MKGNKCDFIVSKLTADQPGGASAVPPLLQKRIPGGGGDSGAAVCRAAGR